MTHARGPRRSRLQRLDDRVLPAVRDGLRSVGRGAGRPFAVFGRLDRGVAGGRLADALHRHRQLVALVAAVIAFTGSFIHLQRYPDPTPVAAGEQRDPATASDGISPDVTSVGPEVGADTESYIEERTAELERAGSGTRVAVISFAEYRTAEDAEAALSEDVTVHRVQARIPMDGADPLDVEVGDDLEATVAAVLSAEREAVAEEEGEFVRLLESDTVTDPEFERFYEAEVERLAAVRNLLDSGTATVFALVVEGEVDVLRELATSEAIRLVDLAPEGVEVDGTAFYGLLPDAGGTVSYGAAI